MKKVPILGDVEQGVDNTIKDLMGPLKMFYPALKLGVIVSNPATLASYVGYRSIPYLLDGLRSRAAIDCYKKIGKLGCKAVGSLGNMAFKYSKKSVMSLGNVAKKQFDKLKEYSLEKINEKDNSLEDIVENHYFDSINLDVNDEFENENPFEFADNNLEQDFVVEPQLKENDIDYELNDDEIDLDCLKMSKDFDYRFTIDSNRVIRRYSVYQNFISEKPQEISREDYHRICNQYYDNQKEKSKELEESFAL